MRADPARLGPPPPRVAAGGAPLTEAERSHRRALWRERLERAEQSLAGYLGNARYPHDSRPASEHTDQMRPFDPVAEDHPLKVPAGSVMQGVRLRTTQERIFLSDGESSRVTVSLVDSQGRSLPLQITRAMLREVPQPGRTAGVEQVPLELQDQGRDGDAQAGDGVFTGYVQPRAQGFEGVEGLLRLELNLAYGGQPGFIFFDFIFSPQVAARWVPGVREVLEQGSLNFYLKAQVLLPGRYVVSARFDDATGRSFALALFNQELPTGPQDIRLSLFGKLVQDEKPVFPVRLRDVDAFLLRPDVHPDRVMLPRQYGVVHTSRSHSLADFSTAEWNSEERQRYVDELTRDVAEAKRELTQLGGP